MNGEAFCTFNFSFFQKGDSSFNFSPFFYTRLTTYRFIGQVNDVVSPKVLFFFLFSSPPLIQEMLIPFVLFPFVFKSVSLLQPTPTGELVNCEMYYLFSRNVRTFSTPFVLKNRHRWNTVLHGRTATLHTRDDKE